MPLLASQAVNIEEESKANRIKDRGPEMEERRRGGRRGFGDYLHSLLVARLPAPAGGLIA